MKKVFAISLALIMMIALIPTAMAADLPFTDVQEADWFYGDVKTAYETGLVNGKSATEYKPDDNMTYAEAVKLAACMNEYAATGAVTLQNGDPWYQSYVDYAKEKGIIDKEYEYNQNATRAGYIEIFANSLPDENLQAQNSVADGSIPDVPMTADYAPSVYKLYRAGILTGVDAAHNCNPDAFIKRSEVAAILTRMMNKDARKEFAMGEETPAEVPTEAPIAVKNELSYNPNVKEYGYNEVISVDEKGVILAENDSRFTNATEVGAIVVFPANEDHPYGLVLKVTGTNHHDYNTDFPTVPATLAEAVKTLNCQKAKAFAMDGLTDASIEVVKNGDDVKVTVTATGTTKAATTAAVYGIYGLLNADVTVDGDAFTAVLKYGETEFKTVTGTVTAK